MSSEYEWIPGYRYCSGKDCHTRTKGLFHGSYGLCKVCAVIHDWDGKPEYVESDEPDLPRYRSRVLEMDKGEFQQWINKQ